MNKHTKYPGLFSKKRLISRQSQRKILEVCSCWNLKYLKCEFISFPLFSPVKDWP
jgi:hypothetical protein